MTDLQMTSLIIGLMAAVAYSKDRLLFSAIMLILSLLAIALNTGRLT